MTFADLQLPSAVASALAARGYDTPTPVQAAVLDPTHGERDLLVSSQTGSGKTVAFGGALANTLLGPAAPARDQRTAPIALVVVPTRELAIQVRDELGWLLRAAGLRLASFTGGTPVGGDLRALQKGLDICIGTPGRLVDLLRRERLDLAHVRVAVLDEADEMLDLGFREDLQTLLQAAPAARRTLLLSATLPPEIRALARRFQRDALHIDPRKGTGSEARDGREAHGDIKYVAHLIAASDRLAVVVNVLRAAGEGRAIVFCTTREAVSRMHAALVARGFAATAISGERAQAERDRALGQVRSGDARILVATNVAARGLHLPDVDWIVHADLPLNAESLTHRSGRTGRAGRKGTAVVIASMSERRKAERLLASANVPVIWTPPPSAAAITAAARDRLVEELSADAAADAPAEDPAAEQMVQRLEATLTPRELARRLLARELGRLPVGEAVQSIAIPRAGSSRRDDFGEARFDDRNSDDRRGSGRSDRESFARSGVLFRVNIGAKDNADPRWLLPLFCRRGGVTRKEVGAIRVGPNETMVEISGEAAADFALAASETDPRAPHVKIERAQTAGAARANGFGASRKPTPFAPIDAPSKDKRAALPARPSPPPTIAQATPPKPRALPPSPAAPPPSPPPTPSQVDAVAARPTNQVVGKSARPKGRVPTVNPIVEMKRAHHMGRTAGPSAARRTDAPLAGSSSGLSASPSASPSSGFGSPRAIGHVTERGRSNGPDDRLRGTKWDRPKLAPPRTDGTNQVKRISAPSREAPAEATTFGPGAGPPFWKQGARKRPGPSLRRPDSPGPKRRPVR